MSEGTVLFFDKRKGAGFIQPASSSKKIFVHASDTKERISAKQTVTYVVVKDKKGERAVQVQVKQP
ncbi:MAG: cold shock domain-containing protein [Haliscomenobacteraceae bacterium CHB4]|nr:cold shock domain-containing protein [Haliscomenobacteraceae bacterium CHB4]